MSESVKTMTKLNYLLFQKNQKNEVMKLSLIVKCYNLENAIYFLYNARTDA